MFTVSFKNGDDDPTRKSFDEYYMPLVEIKKCSACMKTYWNVQTWWLDMTKFRLLYHPKCYKLIEIDQIWIKRNKSRETSISEIFPL